MHNDLDKNAIIFQKILALNRSMGNENVLIVFVGGIFTPHKHHFKYVALLFEDKTKQKKMILITNRSLDFQA